MKGLTLYINPLHNETKKINDCSPGDFIYWQDHIWLVGKRETCVYLVTGITNSKTDIIYMGTTINPCKTYKEEIKG